MRVKLLVRDSRTLLNMLGAGGGKALAHGEKVLTPSGFVNIEDVLVGDEIITPQGQIEHVTGVFPQGVVQLYRVEFQDGRHVDTCGEHLWKFHVAGKGDRHSKIGNTLELVSLLNNKKKHSKGCPIIPLTSPLGVRKKQLPLPPYFLGCILGDGYLPKGGQPSITSADEFIIEQIKGDGIIVGHVQSREGNKSSAYSISGVRAKLRALKLEGKGSFTKFIPDEYKDSSVEDKFSIIQGLFDTDGYISTDGKTYYNTVSEQLSKDVREILFSLGFSVTTTIKTGTYKKDGKTVVCGDCYCLYVRGKNQSRLFRLPRKVERAVDKNVGLKVVSVAPIEPGEATCISISGEEKLFVTTNYVVTHNTRCCLTKYLSYLSDPNFRGVVFRQSLPQLKVSGGIVDESHQIYPLFGGIFKAQAMKWVFPSGATLQFAAIGDDRDLPGWQGSQLTNVLVDEAAEWTEKQILFLLTRMRSAKFEGKLQMVLSANPNSQSYLLKWVEPLLDPETGVPKPGTENITRWFVVIHDKVKFADTKEELYELYGQGRVMGKDFIPKSFKFVPLSIMDNTPLLKNNPEYLANLLSQSRINQLRYLKGSWTAIADGGLVWKTEWAERNKVTPANVPNDCVWFRAYDLASAPSDSEAYTQNDWSVSAKLGKSKSTGLYYVTDIQRFRKTLFETVEEIANTAYSDGVDECTVVIPRDPGAGGLFANQFMVKELAERGVAVKVDVTSGHSSKMSKFLPFCSVCENNLVRWLIAEWNEDTWAELASFTGERSSRAVKDDRVDAISSAFRLLCRANTLPTFTLGNDSYTRPSPLG